MAFLAGSKESRTNVAPGTREGNRLAIATYKAARRNARGNQRRKKVEKGEETKSGRRNGATVFYLVH